MTIYDEVYDLDAYQKFNMINYQGPHPEKLYAKIRELAAQRQDTSFLLYMLNSTKSSYQVWAIDQIKTKRLLQDQHFYPVIIDILNGKDETVAECALDLFEKNDLIDSKIQYDLYRLFDRSSVSMKFDTLRKLSQAETLNQEIIIKLL